MFAQTPKVAQMPVYYPYYLYQCNWKLFLLKGRIPFLQHGDDSVADSRLIIRCAAPWRAAPPEAALHSMPCCCVMVSRLWTGNAECNALHMLQCSSQATVGSTMPAKHTARCRYLEATYGSKLKTKTPPADTGLAVAITHLAEYQYWPQQYHRMWTDKVCCEIMQGLYLQPGHLVCTLQQTASCWLDITCPLDAQVCLPAHANRH